MEVLKQPEECKGCHYLKVGEGIVNDMLSNTYKGVR